MVSVVGGRDAETQAASLWIINGRSACLFMIYEHNLFHYVNMYI